MPPALTIATPLYNSGNFLPKTIESVLGQTFIDFEYLLIDDGSTNNCAAVAGEYSTRDARVRVLRQENQGIARTRNRALQEAAAPIVAFLDHDDVALPQRMEKQMAFLLARPEVAAVGCFLQYVDAKGTPLSVYAPPSEPGDIRAYLRERRSPIPTTALMVRRDAALESGGLNPAFEPIDDYEFSLRLARRHALAVIPEVLELYLDAPGNTSHASVLAMFRGGMAAAYHARQGRYFPPTGTERPRDATTRESLQKAAKGQEALFWSDCFFCLTEHRYLSPEERNAEALFAVEQMCIHGCTDRRRVAARLLAKYPDLPLALRLRWAGKILRAPAAPGAGRPEDWAEETAGGS